MKRFITPLFFGCVFGCTTSPLPSSGFMLDPGKDYDASTLIAQDAFLQIERSYPPGQSVFGLAQSANDPFGQILVGTLRHRGYGITEAVPVNGHRLDYVIDRCSDQGRSFIRLTIILDEVKMSRAYSDSAKPITAWSVQVK